jgi:hypothetical protein
MEKSELNTLQQIGNVRPLTHKSHTLPVDSQVPAFLIKDINANDKLLCMC